MILSVVWTMQSDMTEWLTNNSLAMDVTGSGHSLYQGIIQASTWRTKQSIKNSDWRVDILVEIQTRHLANTCQKHYQCSWLASWGIIKKFCCNNILFFCCCLLSWTVRMNSFNSNGITKIQLMDSITNLNIRGNDEEVLD
jgi:hypothetical protein